MNSFQIGGIYAWARVRDAGDITQHLMIARDATEITVVTAPENLGALDVLEINRDRWRLFDLEPDTPFYCVGFIAKISARLSEAGIDILVASTYSRDLFFVKEDDGEKTAAILRGLGFTESSPAR